MSLRTGKVCFIWFYFKTTRETPISMIIVKSHVVLYHVHTNVLLPKGALFDFQIKGAKPFVNQLGHIPIITFQKKILEGF